MTETQPASQQTLPSPSVLELINPEVRVDEKEERGGSEK